MGIFTAVAAILLAWSGTLVEESSPVIAIAFIIGAVFSATAGYIGMKVATKANVRTTQAARTSLKQALKVSFTGGTVMGLGVAGLAVFGLGGLFIVFLSTCMIFFCFGLIHIILKCSYVFSMVLNFVVCMLSFMIIRKSYNSKENYTTT